MSTEGATASADANHVELLGQVPFLTAVPHEDLEALARSSVLRRYEPGKAIVVQGQFGHSMFVLLSGVLSIRASSDDGAELDLGSLQQPGDFFGEVALLGRGVRSATVSAEAESVLLEIEKNRFELVARRHSTALEELEKYYHARSIATYTRLHRYLGQLPEETIRDLTEAAVMKKFGRDDVACRQGDPADTVMLIKDGVLKMVRPGQDGRLSILAYFNTHDVAGCHDGQTRNYELVALGQAEVIFIKRSAFERMGAQFPEIYKRFSKDDMHRQSALAEAGQTVFGAAQAFLQEGVEVESLLVINLDRCVRCGNCVRACHARHKFTRLDRRGPIFRRRKAVQSRSHEHLLVPSSCRHCRDPECMIGCPTGAIQRFPDGDVDINDNCIGCDNCARKCPYGNITMRPLSDKEQEGREGVTKRAIKCNLCRGYSYSNCVYECPRGAVLRVDPLRYFDELALVMEAEQVDALEWKRLEAEKAGSGKQAKQRIKPRSTLFVWMSLLFFLSGCGGLVSAYLSSPAPRNGGTTYGLWFGSIAAGAIFIALFLGARKRMRNSSIGPLEVWTQFHMVIGVLGFGAALAHAGFQITGVFTTLLLCVFAFEIITGALGQAIYMLVPKMLTRIERHGLAKLIEDLLEEEIEIARGIEEIARKSPPEIGALIRGPVRRAAGGTWSRLSRSYDPDRRIAEVRARVKLDAVPERHRDTVDRLIIDVCRHKDVCAQLRLHRTLKTWLVAHVATAAALTVFLLLHIASMAVVLELPLP